MYKQPLIIIACLLTVTAPLKSVCQEAEAPAKYTNQIGINTTFFFKQFLNFSDNNTIAVSPYVLTYKLISPKNHAFRMGVGGTYSNKKETFENTGQLPRETNAYTLDFSAGYEYRIPLSERWLCFAGADAVTDLISSKVIATDASDETTTITKTTKYGGALVVGIQFNISKRISLFTETSVQFTNSKSSFESKFLNNPGFNFKQVTRETSINFVLPTSLFLAINL
jgi:opacity protein-like surface antigen